MKLLLLLSGKAGTGKDTFADSIASLGFHKYSFAKALKDEASRGGWDGAKDERGRVLLQQLGTVWRNYDPEHWIRRLQESITHAGKRDVFSPCWGNGGAEMKIFVSVLWAVWVGSSMMAVWTIWNIIMELGG